MKKTAKILLTAAAMIVFAGCDDERFNTANQQFFAPHQPGAAGKQDGSSGMTGSAGGNNMYTPPPLYGQAQPGQPSQPMMPEAPKSLIDSGIQGDSQIGGTSAVAYASKLKDKCIDLQNELIKAQKEKQDADEKIRALQVENMALRNEKAQAEKELADANQTIMKIQKDLDLWKRDVSKFREEFMGALADNLGASYKIIGLLGGDVPRQSSKTPAPSASHAPSPSDSKSAAPQEGENK